MFGTGITTPFAITTFDVVFASPLLSQQAALIAVERWWSPAGGRVAWNLVVECARSCRRAVHTRLAGSG